MRIEKLEHIALGVPDPHAVAADYAALLDRPVDAGDDGPRRRLQCENTALVLAANAGARDGAKIGLCFAVSDLEAAKHRLQRRGLPGVHDAAAPGRWDLAPAATHDVAIGVVPSAVQPAAAGTGDIAGLDHVVIRTPDAERAVALYGGRLGLDLRLDRTSPEIGARQLFFVCGDLVIEVVQGMKEASREGADRIWGLAWRARDLEGAHGRMREKGIAVTDLREGRRPGTRVFTVKSHVAGVPTLVIGGQGLERR